MKTIPKRSDLYTNPTEKNSNLEKQMSELLQIKSVLGEKLQVLMKIVGREVQNFVTRNCPMDISDVSTVDLERNLFGTGRGFSEFNKQYTELSLKIDADIKGVVQVLQKFSFTKNLSLFVTQGILDNFLRINQLFLKRQSHCSSILKQIQSSVITGTSIFTKNPLQSSLCSKCLNQLQKENILSTKQEILLGGRKVLQYYNSQLEEGPSSEEQEAWCKEDDSFIQQFYDRIRKIKRKVRKEFQGQNCLVSEEDMRCNLDRLSSNIQQRKFDILACLIEMGQFGQQVIRSSQNLEKLSSKSILPNHNSQKDHLQPQNITLSSNPPVSSTPNIPPKFNFQQFTFSIGKHFFKQIKDIESQLSFIKNRYSSLLSDQQQRQRSQETQCDLAKDFYEKQNDKQKRKSDRQIKALHDRVKQLEEQNNRHKAKIDQYQNAVKTYISGKIEMDFVQVEKITMEKKIARLIEKYQLKLNQQEKQLIMFREFGPSNKDRVKVTDFKTVHNLQPSLAQIPTEESNNYSIKDRKMYKQNRLTQQPSFTSGTKNKISFYLQPMMKKVYEKSSFTSSSKNDSKTFQPSENATQKIIRQEYLEYDDGNMKIDDYRDQVDNRNNLNLVSEVLSINLKNVRKDSFAQFNKRQDAGENYYSYEKEAEYETNGNFRYKRKQKIVKVKSQQDVTKIQSKNESSHSQQQQQTQKPQRATQSTSTQLIKRYSSQHTTFNQPTNTPTNDQIPQSNPSSKNKTHNKLLKALSLTFLKKHPQLISTQQGEKQVKLPSLSQHQHMLSSNNCKIKEMQKSLQYNKNMSTGLTKKKRKKRHFSQEDIKKRENSFAYDSKPTKVSPDKKFMIDKAIKEKQKKQYIIDFIPKVQEQSRAKAVPNNQNFDIQNTQIQIQKLFTAILNKPTTFHNDKFTIESNTKDKQSKPKHLTQHPTKKSKSKASLYQLHSSQISLSTLLYSSLAKLKSYNSRLYSNIRENFTKYYQSQEKVIKTNCDDIQMTMSVTEESSLKDKSHFPLSLSGDDIQGNNESSFHQSVKEKNKQNVHSLNKTLNQSILKSSGSPHKQSEQTQLRKIITYLIIKHRKTCHPVSISSKPQKKEDKTQINACEHIVNFYKFLTTQLQNSINQCV